MSKRIITARDGATGYITELEKDRATAINLNPEFTEEKPWQLIKVLKTTTKIIPWLIKINEDFIAVTQGHIWRQGEMVMFYRTNKRGTYDILRDRITQYPGYVDLEAAVDRYYAENYVIQENPSENETIQENEV
jgi:hypothetical protein